MQAKLQVHSRDRVYRHYLLGVLVWYTSCNMNVDGFKKYISWNILLLIDRAKSSLKFHLVTHK